jgi:hypothetical protein
LEALPAEAFPKFRTLEKLKQPFGILSKGLIEKHQKSAA